MDTNNLSTNKEVMSVLNKLIRAQEKCDWHSFAECFAKGETDVHIGTDMDEFWTNWNSFEITMKEAFQTRKGLSITDKNTHIQISRDGSVAWYSQLIDTCLETKLEPVRIEGFRHTGVMEKKDGTWKIVQSHYSAPVPVDSSFSEGMNQSFLSSQY